MNLITLKKIIKIKNGTINVALICKKSESDQLTDGQISVLY